MGLHSLHHDADASAVMASDAPLLQLADGWAAVADASGAGLFKAHSDGEALRGSASLADLPDLPDLPGLRQAEGCIAWPRQLDRLWSCAETAPQAITLAPGEGELVSFAPIERGFAAIGLADKLNSGDFLAWAQQRPAAGGPRRLRLRWPAPSQPLALR